MELTSGLMDLCGEIQTALIQAALCDREDCGRNAKAPAWGARQSPRDVLVNGVPIFSHGERTLRITRDCKIRMIEQIVDFCSNCDLHALPQFEALPYRQIKLCEGGTSQNIAAGSSLSGGTVLDFTPASNRYSFNDSI
jgi:hypothetical protein